MPTIELDIKQEIEAIQKLLSLAENKDLDELQKLEIQDVRITLETILM